MLIALNKDKKRVNAQDCIDSNNKTTKYVCPSCKQDLVLKKGTIKIAHFAHKKKSECISFSEGETEEHLLGKQLLFEMLRKNMQEVYLEAYLSDLKQRPDILWKTDEEKIAIEFQCTTLNIRRMKERTSNYKRRGYKVIWILGKNLHIKNKLTNLQKTFVGITDSGIFYSLEFDVSNKMFTVIYNLNSINHSRRIDYKIKSWPIKSKDNIIRFMRNSNGLNFEVNNFPRYNLSIRDNYIRSNAYYSNRATKLFMEKIYQNRDSLISIPIECYVTLPCDWMISSSNMLWKYYLLKFIQLNSKNEFTTKELKCVWEKLITNKLLILSDFPLVSSDVLDTPLKEFCNFLVKQNILKDKGDQVWRINKRPIFYRNERAKYKQIFLCK
ncbi:competence protein CoiA [Lacticigenium naphthae]|uniref:competence protein CoiA n=1 Tax=Lacticigenium naphthae TaxID=515351 RepID=UPI000407F395|nr:competence protein CoiA family protein [Lacticigenium naphthae]